MVFFIHVHGKAINNNNSIMIMWHSHKYTVPFSHCTFVCRKKLERPALLVLGLREYKNHHDLASTNSRYRLKKSCLGMVNFLPL